MKKTYKIDVDCANCANKMEAAAQKTPGVKNAAVNFMTLKMSVEFEDGQDVKAVMQQVRANCKHAVGARQLQKGGERLRDLRDLTSFPHRRGVKNGLVFNFFHRFFHHSFEKLENLRGKALFIPRNVGENG